ncbi:hypothetical protein [Spirilliplanes yamanashiensis]|uniref:Heparinase II/III-like protein n=1 Tax=Spirilliplanes yamanashiensis TaxID=42233 RepID=A0A8J4DKB6_9ACTN|nr:hypothetical protein [Spirilliplanes yamanashiensis]MDP9815631.1 hypothetical protein [Spirilliplanes yamanashiensis]GIJ03885.1 hypothetical protein Sya03_32370 [Spirilliplanes yamanashiensis]
MSPRVTRRALIAAAGAAALAPATTFAAPARAAVPGTPLAPIAALPPGAPARHLFSQAEQRFARYLATLPGIVNDIDTGTNPDTYGHLAGGWSRTPAGPTNARVQEHVFTMSWYLANPRAWNPYHRDPALLARLDAALFHYLRLQHADGSFPEYSGTEHGLAPTGFGIGYLARTLENLRRADVLPETRGRVGTALRRAVGWLLDRDNPIWDVPVEWSNQVCAGLAGTAITLQLLPDSAMRAAFTERMAYFARYAQSPAGFFYDPTGSDINYNFEVMLPELAELYLRSGNADAVRMARLFAEWFGHQMLREPDGSGWLTYYAVSARTASAAYDETIGDEDRQTLGSAFIPVVPDLAAFYTSREDKAAARAAWAAEPGPAPALPKGDTSPRIVAHATYPERLPSRAAKQAAVARLPYLRSTDFAEVRDDELTGQQYLYVRRPGYYLGAFFGPRPTTTVKAGPGFLWHPAAGTLVHAQQTTTGAWGTATGGVPDAASTLTAEYLHGTARWTGARITPGGTPVVVRYRTTTGVATTLTLDRTGLTRAVRAPGAATEQVPLVLLPTDTVTFADGTPVGYDTNAGATATGLVLRRGATTLTVSWGTPLAATVGTSSRTYLRDGRRRVHVLRVPHGGSLDVRYAVS